MRAEDDRPGNLQAIAFLAAALAGAGSIVALKLLGVRQLVVTAVPCLIMLGYAALVVRPYFRARADQVGDNLYYLGFISTLVSLSVSLGQFSAGGSAEEIVANFGIALGTTLLGVTLRVMFNQMRSDPIETEREARMQLAEASRRLKAELTNASTEFAMAARASRQSVTDTVAELELNFGRSLTNAGLLLHNAVEASATGLTEASEDLHEQIGQASARLAAATTAAHDALTGGSTRWAQTLEEAMARSTEFNTAARKLVMAVEKLGVRMDGGGGPSAEFEARMTDVLDQFDATMNDAVERIAAEIAGALQRTVEGLPSAADVRTLSDRIDAVSAR